VSLSDPDARPIRKGKLGRPNELGYVNQLCEVAETRSFDVGQTITAFEDLDLNPSVCLVYDRLESSGGG